MSTQEKAEQAAQEWCRSKGFTEESTQPAAWGLCIYAFLAGVAWAQAQEQAKAQKLVEDLKLKIIKHKEYYHTDIFPDYKINIESQPSIDRVSAKMGRHMCDRFLDYINEALAEYHKTAEQEE